MAEKNPIISFLRERKIVDEATLQAVRQSAVGLSRSTWGLSVTVWLANALLVMLCVCTVVWLRKARR